MSSRRRFTSEEEQFIRTHYQSMSYGGIAESLGRTVRSIEHRAIKLGLRKNFLRRWTREEDEVIGSSTGRSLADVARQLERGESEVSSRARIIGLDSWVKRRGYRPLKSGHKTRGYIRRNGRTVLLTEHRAVMEEHLGRPLRRDEPIHHINGDKLDNRIENLYLCDGPSEHRRIHLSIESFLPDLLERGIIRFDRTKGTYELCETSK